MRFQSSGLRRLGVAAAVTASLIVTLGACAPAEQPAPSGPRTLTDAEAERLAVVRFRNFDAGTRAIELQIPGTDAGELQVTGWFDYTAHVGYGMAFTDEGSAGLVWWDETTIAVREAPVEDAPLPLPADGWQSGPLDPSSTPLATALTLVGSLGSDRPENPQLLRQSDAAWLRTDQVDDLDVDVFAGPSTDDQAAQDAEERTRFWVDADGMLLRFEARLGSGDSWFEADFSDADVSLPTEAPAG